MARMPAGAEDADQLVRFCNRIDAESHKVSERIGDLFLAAFLRRC